jgi:prophage DNA circulation protein
VSSFEDHKLRKAVNCLRKAVDCLWKAINCLRKAINCLRKAVNCLWKAVNCLWKAVNCLWKAVNCLWKAVNCLRKAVNGFGERTNSPFSGDRCGSRQPILGMAEGSRRRELTHEALSLAHHPPSRLLLALPLFAATKADDDLDA